MGQFVTIPFDYDDLLEEERKRIIPIVVHALDERGYPIPQPWFEQGIAPVHRHLVTIAKWHLGDPWEASHLVEVTQPFVRTVRKGCRALSVASVYYVWVAQNLSAGGSRADRNRQARHVSIQGMEEAVIDPTDYTDRYHRDLLFEAVARKLAETGRLQMKEVLGLVRLGHTWPEIAKRFGFASEQVLKKRFQKNARNAAGEFCTGE